MIFLCYYVFTKYNTKEDIDMNKKKLEKKDRILLGVLAALIVIVIAVGIFLIVKNTNSANEQTKGVTSSNVSGEISSSSQTSSNAESKTSSDKKSSGSKSDNSSVNSSAASDNSQNNGANTPSNSSKKSSSKASSKTSSKAKVKGDKVKRVKPKENTSHATNKTLSVNGKTCYVGDTITVVMNITSNKSIVNYQGAMSFNDSYLKVKDVKSNDFGIANASGNSVMYNASNLNGMNFSETGTVFTATFEVLKSGSTKLENNVEIISELIDNNIKQLAPSDYKATVEVYS